MAAKLKVDQVESVDGSTNIILNNSVTMATNKTLPAPSLTGNLPAISGANLTALNATNLGSGTVPTARLGSGTASSSVFLSGAGTWIAAGSSSASDLTSGTLPIARIANDAIDSIHYAAGSIDNEHLADDAVGVAELSATGTASSTTFLRGDNSWQTAGSTSATDLTSGTLPTARLPAGSIVQVVTAVNTSTVTTSATTFSDVMSVAFTPTNASNKLLIRCQLGEPDTATGRGHAICWVGSNSTEVFRLCTEFGRGEDYGAESHTQNIVAESDFITAASTSARTYGMALKNNVGGTFRVGNGADHKITIMEIQV